jgi:GTPase SAR1 family protein
MPILRIIVLGPKGAGKLSLLSQLTTGYFPASHDPTDDRMFRKQVHISPVLSANDKRQKHRVMLELYCDAAWRSDTSPAIVQQMLSLDEAWVLVYDINDRASYEVVKDIHRNHISQPRQEQARMEGWVVANQIDRLKDGEGAVSEAEGRKWADDIGARFWMTSAKKREGCGTDALMSIARDILLSRMKAEGQV